jgi:hypothetical protein
MQLPPPLEYCPLCQSPEPLNFATGAGLRCEDSDGHAIAWADYRAAVAGSAGMLGGKALRVFCAQSAGLEREHRLQAGPVLKAAIFGSTASGKTHYLVALARALARNPLHDHFLFTARGDNPWLANTEGYWGAIASTQADDGIVPLWWEAQHPKRRDQRFSLLVLDTVGEQNRRTYLQDYEDQFAKWAFIRDLDVVIIALPYEELAGGADSEAAGRLHDDVERGQSGSLGIANHIGAFLRAHHRYAGRANGRWPLVVVAVTKFDQCQYGGEDMARLMRPHYDTANGAPPLANLPQLWQADQSALLRLLLAQGMGPLVDGVDGPWPVALTAVSDAGYTDREGRFPSGASKLGRDHVLDPIAMAMWQMGIGRADDEDAGGSGDGGA